MENTVIQSTFEIKLLEQVGEGGMGKIYRAVLCGADGFEKTVAVKTLRGDANIETIGRMIREAKLVSGLVHVNIVQILQFCRCAENYFIIMEYVDGISLHDFIEFHRALKESIPIDYAAFIVGRVARALAYAHSRCDERGISKGIVHCDVCPQNIMISREGVVKLTDFGIARGKAASTADENQEKRLCGKAAYMSPEQASELEPDFRSDIYSLGMVLFELLSNGAKPRGENGTSVQKMLYLARCNVLNWNLLPPDTPASLINLLHVALATDPEERCSDAAALAAELEKFNLEREFMPNISKLADYMARDMPARFGKYETTLLPENVKTLAIDTGKGH